MSNVSQIPSPAAATQIVHEANLGPGGKAMKNQAIAAFAAQLKGAKESNGTFTLAFEMQVNTHGLFDAIAQPGKLLTDTAIQGAIRSGYDAFVREMASTGTGYTVKTTYAPLAGVGDGGYDVIKATISWKAV